MRPNFVKKSAPMIGLAISATTNACGKSRRRPKSNEKNFEPYVLIGVPFAAVKTR